MMKDTDKATRGFADPHPDYSALCILPDGKIETKGQAELDGFTIRPAPPAPSPALPPKRLVPVAPPKAAAPAPSPIVLAERARAQAILAMAPKGAEAEADKAIRSGMSVAEFKGNLAAWSILDARRRAEGRA